MHPDTQELIPLLVNQSAYALIHSEDPRKALKKLRRLQTVIKAANRKNDPDHIVGLLGRIASLLGR